MRIRDLSGACAGKPLPSRSREGGRRASSPFEQVLRVPLVRSRRALRRRVPGRAHRRVRAARPEAVPASTARDGELASALRWHQRRRCRRGGRERQAVEARARHSRRRRSPFGQGTLVRFRTKAIEHDLDKKLVDRTVELAKRTKKYSWKHLKVALDSSPLEGAGRVDDTWNLIGRAMSKVVGAVARATGVDEAVVVEGAGLTVLEGPSIKAALDVDWGDADERHEALQRLVVEAEQLEAWVVHQLKDDATKPPVSDSLTLLRRIVEQDLEPDPDGGGDRIRDGVAEDRVISVGDPEMRHGRKSQSKTINGYKRHIVIANRIILGTAVEPANRPEHEAMPRLFDAARRQGQIVSAHFDRGYLRAPRSPRFATMESRSTPAPGVRRSPAFSAKSNSRSPSTLASWRALPARSRTSRRADSPPSTKRLVGDARSSPAVPRQREGRSRSTRRKTCSSRFARPKRAPKAVPLTASAPSSNIDSLASTPSKAPRLVIKACVRTNSTSIERPQSSTCRNSLAFAVRPRL